MLHHPHCFWRSSFNRKIVNLSPEVTHLCIGHCFHQQVNNLPSKLTHLTFGKNFIHSVSTHPAPLTHLTLGSHFDQRVNYLTHTRTHLSLDSASTGPLLSSANDLNRSVCNPPSFLIHAPYSCTCVQPSSQQSSSVTPPSHLSTN